MTDNRTDLSIAWRTIAVASAIVALGALVAAAIVATVKHADTLSVIALAVAIVAFVVQILVFIAQAAAASAQEVRAQEIYGSTLKVLATIEEKAEGTHQVVSSISDRMLTAIIGKAIPDAVESGVSVDSAAFSVEVANRVTDLVRQVNPEDASVVSPSSRASNVAPIATVAQRRDLRLSADDLQYPIEINLDKILERMLKLDARSLQHLSQLGTDYVAFHSTPELLGLALPVEVQKPLLDAGMIRLVDRPLASGRAARPKAWILTENGQLAARILLAPSIPDGAPEVVLKVRETLALA